MPEPGEYQEALVAAYYGGPTTGSPINKLVQAINLNSRLVQLVHDNRKLSNLLRVLPGTEIDSRQIVDCTETNSKRIVMKDVITWLDQSIQAYGGTLIIAYIPKARYFVEDSWPKCEHDMVAGLTEEIGVELIDMTPTFNTDDPRALYANRGLPGEPYQPGHPSRYGYQVIAEKIIERLNTLDAAGD